MVRPLSDCARSELSNIGQHLEDAPSAAFEGALKALPDGELGSKALGRMSLGVGAGIGGAKVFDAATDGDPSTNPVSTAAEEGSSLGGAWLGAEAGMAIGGLVPHPVLRIGAMAVLGAVGAVAGSVAGEVATKAAIDSLTEAESPEARAIREKNNFDREIALKEFVVGGLLIEQGVDFEPSPDDHSRINAALRKGHTPQEVVDAIKGKLPGALSFLASGRDRVDDSNGLHAPQIGGVEPGDLVRQLSDLAKKYNPATDPANTELAKHGGDPANNPIAGNVPGNPNAPGYHNSPDSKPNTGAGFPNGADKQNMQYGPGTEGGHGGAPGSGRPGTNQDGPGGGNAMAGPDSSGAENSAGSYGKPNISLKSNVTGTLGGGVPIVLDLDGNGVRVSELSKSQRFVEAGGDGLKNRSAWAGAGDGVLFYDADGSGGISDAHEFIFSEWDPTAPGDLEAIRGRFDSNGDGKLDASDMPAAEWAKWKVEVVNPDGTVTVKTLTAAGITSIDLTANATRIELPDGRAAAGGARRRGPVDLFEPRAPRATRGAGQVITGQTTYTKAGGGTGTVANMLLAYDADGDRVIQTSTINTSNQRVITTRGRDADGDLDFRYKSVAETDGSAITNYYDEDGPNYEHKQLIEMGVCAMGVKERTGTVHWMRPVSKQFHAKYQVAGGN